MIVCFDKTIYSESAVRQAIKDYSAIAQIELMDSGKEYSCFVKQSKYSLEKTILEFSNYVLSLSVMSEKTL